MSKDKIQLLSPLFLKYQSDFEKNPRSRVFAPLAETYRKLGMNDKAMEILSQGIRFNPSYLMGYLGLAFCYYDLHQYNLAYSTIRPLIESNRDNIRLQKLFADVCLELGKKEEALETLKYIMFINPRDKNVAELLTKVEREVDDKYKPHHKPIIIPDIELTDQIEYPKKSESNDFDDWMTIDLNSESKGPKTTAAQSFDHWNIKKADEELPKIIEEPRSFHVHLDLDRDEEDEDEEENDDGAINAPLVTHTLVDLYCGQGHIEKALEVLEKILLLNPNDQKTIHKIKEIQALVQPLEKYDQVKDQENTEEDGRRHLMNLIDEKLGPIEPVQEDSREELARLVEEKLSLFLKKIQKRALDYQARV